MVLMQSIQPMLNYHCYVAIINKCNEIPAYFEPAKHISLIMLYIYMYRYTTEHHAIDILSSVHLSNANSYLLAANYFFFNSYFLFTLLNNL